uniref:Uncharacterized protein n=1 Tax=Phasianus colchicus TaxID=9054 RepID=A0A669PW82_PHACC
AQRQESHISPGLQRPAGGSSFQPAASSPGVGILLLGFSMILPDGMWIICRRRAGSRKILGMEKTTTMIIFGSGGRQQQKLGKQLWHTEQSGKALCGGSQAAVLHPA